MRYSFTHMFAILDAMKSATALPNYSLLTRCGMWQASAANGPTRKLWHTAGTFKSGDASRCQRRRACSSALSPLRPPQNIPFPQQGQPAFQYPPGHPQYGPPGMPHYATQQPWGAPPPWQPGQQGAPQQGSLPPPWQQPFAPGGAPALPHPPPGPMQQGHQGQPPQGPAVQPQEQALQQGIPFVYDEATGQLTHSGLGRESAAHTMRFVETAVGGDFQRVHDPNDHSLRSRLFRGAALPPAALLPEELGRAPTQLGALKAAADNCVACVGLLSQSLLGGFSLLNLYMTYLFAGSSLPSGSSSSGFLHYYSPLASTAQATYLVLVTTSLLTAIDKYSRDRLASFVPRGSSQRLRDISTLLLYSVSFIVSIILARPCKRLQPQAAAAAAGRPPQRRLSQPCLRARAGAHGGLAVLRLAAGAGLARNPSSQPGEARMLRSQRP